jgi:transcriptional regulator with XRE-family HTH domain
MKPATYPTPLPQRADPALMGTGNTLELGAFLRARRESLDPVRLGIPRTGRKRTPGLRREDVAAMADIGITWYTKLEQGRPIRVSHKVLSAVASALQCSDTETAHLFTLAGVTPPVQASQLPVSSATCPANQTILDHLDPIPALIQNARFDILYFNQAYCRLVNVDLADIAPEDRNCIYLAIVNPAWRASLADWEDMMPRMVAQYRAAMAEHMHEAAWEKQLQRFFSASDEFRECWHRYEVRGVENQVKRFRHAQHGVLNLHQSNWWSAAKNGYRMLVYVPVDPHSEQALQALAQADE